MEGGGMGDGRGDEQGKVEGNGRLLARLEKLEALSRRLLGEE